MFLATLGTFPGTGNKLVVAWAFLASYPGLLPPKNHLRIINTYGACARGGGRRPGYEARAFPRDHMGVINPRRACAARVTVVGSVCPSVCLSVCVSVTFDLPSRMSNRAINKRAY